MENEISSLQEEVQKVLSNQSQELEKTVHRVMTLDDILTELPQDLPRMSELLLTSFDTESLINDRRNTEKKSPRDRSGSNEGRSRVIKEELKSNMKPIAKSGLFSAARRNTISEKTAQEVMKEQIAQTREQASRIKDDTISERVDDDVSMSSYAVTEKQNQVENEESEESSSGYSSSDDDSDSSSSQAMSQKGNEESKD